jgi:hypothetical protein
MIQLVLFLALGSGLILLLFLFSRHNRRRMEGGAQAVVEARQALVALQSELLPPAILGRVFDRRDLEYVLAEAPKDVQELLLQERRRIALCWVGQIRQRIVSLREFHLGSARFYAGLSPKTELRLATDFFALLSICRFLELAIRWRGPYAAPRMVGRAALAAARVCDLSERYLDFLKPSRFETFRRGSVRNPTLP